LHAIQVTTKRTVSSAISPALREASSGQLFSEPIMTLKALKMKSLKFQISGELLDADMELTTSWIKMD